MLILIESISGLCLQSSNRWIHLHDQPIFILESRIKKEQKRLLGYRKAMKRKYLTHYNVREPSWVLTQLSHVIFYLVQAKPKEPYHTNHRYGPEKLRGMRINPSEHANNKRDIVLTIDTVRKSWEGMRINPSEHANNKRHSLSIHHLMWSRSIGQTNRSNQPPPDRCSIVCLRTRPCMRLGPMRLGFTRSQPSRCDVPTWLSFTRSQPSRCDVPVFQMNG
jgi:hypothetical protein